MPMSSENTQGQVPCKYLKNVLGLLLIGLPEVNIYEFSNNLSLEGMMETPLTVTQLGRTHTLNRYDTILAVRSKKLPMYI